MSRTAHHQMTAPRRRYGFGPALLIAGILAFGGFALLTDGRLTTTGLLSGFNDIVGR